MGLSIWHLIIIVFILLLMFGPKRLPDLGRSLGEAIRGFKKGLNENEVDVTETSRLEQNRQQKIADDLKEKSKQE
ncbi:MAG: twin-arginine translocase TatA/TatE family subunit [Bdellovibrionales bacterium]